MANLVDPFDGTPGSSRSHATNVEYWSSQRHEASEGSQETDWESIGVDLAFDQTQSLQTDLTLSHRCSHQQVSTADFVCGVNPHSRCMLWCHDFRARQETQSRTLVQETDSSVEFHDLEEKVVVMVTHAWVVMATHAWEVTVMPALVAVTMATHALAVIPNGRHAVVRNVHHAIPCALAGTEESVHHAIQFDLDGNHGMHASVLGRLRAVDVPRLVLSLLDDVALHEVE